ncbi:MAG: hypothetical protein WD079_06210, partial [Phycisphaeraceae bacterium]
MRIGFVSTRFAGTDGVSLESAKLAEVLWEDRHTSYWYAGRLDRAPDVSYCVPEAFFGHPANTYLNERVLGRPRRSRVTTQRIYDMTQYLKETLYRFADRFKIDLLMLQNVVTIPMHIPLGIAVTEFIAETQMPALAHHHDFYWERDRFRVTAV